jgi:ABC-type sugar transport system ATPase subunit
MENQATGLLTDLHLTVPSVRTSVARMSGGQRQMIAVGRSVGSAVKVLVLDEPTAALGLRESKTLLDTIVRLRDAGTSIILVTHRLPDILAIGDRIMVLKSGVSQGVVSVAESNLESVEQLIVAGRPRAATASAAATAPSADDDSPASGK